MPFFRGDVTLRWSASRPDVTTAASAIGATVEALRLNQPGEGMPLTRAVSVMDPPYGARGIGRSWDDTDAFRRALEDHDVVHCPRPPVGYSINWSGEKGPDDLKICVPIPGGRRLIGDGATVFTNLPKPAHPEESMEHADDNTVSWFWVPERADDVAIEGLDFVGQAARVTPQNHRLNLQMCVVEAMWGARAPTNLRIEHCGFFNQWGFVTHQRGGGRGYVFRFNGIVDCMNGVNWNSDAQRCEANDVLRAEGFECSGSGSEYVGNSLTDVYGGLSIGGNMGSGPASHTRGSRIAHNSIHHVIGTPGYVPQGITIADNMFDWDVADNTIHRASGVAILVHTSDGKLRRSGRGRIRGNWIVASRNHAIYLVACDDVEIADNTIEDQDPTGRLLYPGERTPGAIVLDAGFPGENIRIGPNTARVSGASAIVVPPGWRRVTIARHATPG